MATQDVPVAIEGLMRAIDTFLTKTVAKLALDIHANLVKKPQEGGTPVDTGWARANWIPRIKEKVTEPAGSRPTADGPSPSGLALFTDTGASTAGAAEIATKYRIDLGDIYVSNAVPYIGHLNNGTSTQAPAGFVQNAIVRAIVEDAGK